MCSRVPSSLLLGTLELLGGTGATYNVLDENGSFGDPQAVTQTIRAQLTMGSAVTGDFTDNRAMSFQVMVAAANRLELAQAVSALRAIVNSTTPTALRWAPDGGLPVYYDITRGQTVAPPMSWASDSVNVSIVTITMAAWPFARSTTQRMLTGASSSVQLGNFAQSTEYAYTTPNSADLTPYGFDQTSVPCPLTGTVYGEQPSPPPIDGAGSMQLSLGGYTRSGAITSTLAKVGPVVGSWDLSGTTNLTVGVATLDSPGSIGVTIRLGDSDGTYQTFTGSINQTPRGTAAWLYVTIDLSAATIDLDGVTSWTMWLGTDNWNTAPTLYYFLGMLRAYPSLAALASTTNGAMYKLAGVLGDARAPASIEFNRITGGGNILPAGDASNETTGSWVGTGCTVARSSTFAVDGTYSLQLASTAGGVMTAITAQVAVKPLTQYTAAAQFRAGSTPRTSEVIVNWYDASHTFITNTGAASIITDSTSAWIQTFITDTSPATAAYCAVEVYFSNSNTSELHYIDEISLQAGPSTVFSAGTPWPSISGFLAYRAPSSASINTPALVQVLSGTATTAAPAALSGTYRVIAVDVSPIAGGASMVVTQTTGSTSQSVTLVSTVVAGGTRWGDFGDLTFPLFDIPSQASSTTYTFTVTGTDVILCDTRGFMVWVPTMTPANYVWIDEATAFGMGGVFSGTMPDRSDATSLLGLLGVQPSNAMSVDPGDDYLLTYCLDGAPSNVTVSYYDRYLGERTAA